MSDNIKVAIKVRPLIKREIDSEASVQWAIQESTIFPIDSEGKKRGEGFTFDHILDTKMTNRDVFNIVVKPIVVGAINGFNGTIFAYGQTSSGKTYTMLGTKREPGVVCMAVEYIWDNISNNKCREYLLRVAYLEIYKEKVNDLLDRNNIDLKLHEDFTGQITVKCREEVANCCEQVMTIMKRGEKHRQVSETNMNDKSSRSHTIFRITIESRELSDPDGAVQVSHLNLVDLAGSEKSHATADRADRFQEGRHINLSLSTLGLVIMQLSECQEGKHINFRDSKLTRLLQASLGGNAMTAIICAVTPAAVEETQCTLSFAARAKSIKNKPKLNEVTTDATLLKRYSKQVKKLEDELQELRKVNQCAKVEEMQSQLQEKDRMNQLLEERIELLKTRIVSGDNNAVSESSSTNKTKRRRTWGGCLAASSALRQSTDLPTIKEQDSSEVNYMVSNRRRIKRRQSIMQSSVCDIVNEKFQTAIEDFELELIRSEQQWADSRYSIDSVDCEEDTQGSDQKIQNHVRFMDDVSVISCTYDDRSPDKNAPSSPSLSGKVQSPDTPKEVLRRRIDLLADEYKSLREFTTLEKQMFVEEGGRNRDLGSMEESLNYMKKSVADSEMMCRESNKKLAELQGEHSELTLKYDAVVEECRALKEHVKAFHGIEESLSTLQQEKRQLQTTMNENLERLKTLKEEKVDFEFRIELLEKKHKTREKELENSLQLAWKDVMDTTNKEKFFDAVHLRAVVDSLSKENETIKSKLEDVEKSFEIAEEMKNDLLKQLEELKKVSEEQTSDEVAVLRKRVAELELELESLQIVSVDKRGEAPKSPEEFEEPSIPPSSVEQVENILKEEFSDKEETILKLNQQLEELTAKLEEHGKIKSDFEVLQTESDQLKAELSNREVTISKLAIQLDEMSAKLEENSNIKREFELMQTKCDHLKEELCNREATAIELTNKLEEMKSNLEGYSDIKRDFEVINVKCKQQAMEISKIGDRVAAISASELHVTNEYNMNVLKLEQVQSEKELVMSENLELMSKFSETTDKLRNNEYVIDALKSDIDNLKTKLEEKNIKLSNMKVKLGELQEISTQVEYSSKESTTDNAQRIIVLEEELKNSKSELNAKLEEFNKQKSEIAILVDAVATKTNEISTLNETIDKIQCENEKLQNNLKCLTEELESKTVESGSDKITKYKNTMPAVDISFEQLYNEMISHDEGVLDKFENLTHTDIPQNNASHSEGEFIDSETILEDGHCLKDNTSRIQEEDIQEKTCRRSITGVTVNEKTDGGFNMVEAGSNGVDGNQKQIVPSDSFDNIDDALKLKLRDLALNNDALVSENMELKTKIEMFIQEVTVQASSEDVTTMQAQLTALHSAKNNLESDLAERNKKICELQNDVEKLKEQIIEMQSERTLLEGEKCAMQKIIKEKEEDLRRIPKLEAHMKDLGLVKSEFEHMNAELRKELNAKILELDSKDAYKYESEIRNLKSYVADLELFNKNIQSENDELKIQLQNQSLNLENDVSELKRRIDEQERITHILEEDKEILLQHLDKPISADTEPTVNVTNVSTVTTITTPESPIKPTSSTNDTKIYQAEGESSSIFANGSYFENLDVSYEQDDSVFEHTSQTIAELSLDAKSYNSPEKSERGTEELIKAKTLLEDENAKLAVELQLKIQEYDEIKNDFNMLKLDIEKTVQLLTTENTDLASKLNAEKERAKKVEADLEVQVNDLYTRMSKLAEERVSLESELVICHEQLEALRMSTPVATEDAIRAKFEEYSGKINSLTAENIELSTNLMDKIEELDKVKESKALLYDHDCMYKEQVELQLKKIESVQCENIELSSSLMEKIEEADSLKNTCELLEKKLEVFKNNMLGGADNDVVQLKIENNQLKAEAIELEAKVKTLSKENAKFSNNLMETMEELDNTRNNENSDDKSQDGTLHLSVGHNNSAHESNNDLGADENVDVLSSKIKVLEQQIDQLTRLNKKLSELKQSSCVQCTHLKELNDSRRTLKLEVKSLNHKLGDLQRKFEQKCADTEVLRKKASEELNCSTISDTTLNESMMEGMDVTSVEDKIQTLNAELEALKENHDVLSALYKDKCCEIDKLKDVSISDASSTSYSKQVTPDVKKNRARIERIQEDIDELRKELQLLRKRNTNLSESLHKFLGEKSNMQNEIDLLRSDKEELMKNAMNFEVSAETAQEKVRILESEISNSNEEMERLTLLVKELENNKLKLEVTNECLEADKERCLKTLELKEASLYQEKENHISVREKLETMMKKNNELAKRLEESQEECKKVAKESENKLNSYLQENNELLKRLEEKEKSNEEMKRLTLLVKGLENDKLKLEVANKCLETDIERCQKTLELKEASLNQEKENHICAREKWETMIKENNELLKRLEESQEECKKLAKESDNKLNSYLQENTDLIEKVKSLQAILEASGYNKREETTKAIDLNVIKQPDEKITEDVATLVTAHEKLKEELNAAREYIIKEIRSLKPKHQKSNFSDKSVSELLSTFFNIIMQKEKEIIKAVQDSFEQDKQRLEDEKRQSIDAKKRVTVWAKELETDIEKLQADLSNHESKNRSLQDDIDKLENNLKESNHENQLLKDQIQVLETDFNSLQAELEKRSKVDDKQGEVVIAAQEREKSALEAAKNNEAELKSRMKIEKDQYNKRIEELTSSYENFRTKNMELQSNIEGLEANERQLKSIVEVKSNDLAKSHQRSKTLEAEIEQLTETCNQLKSDVLDKTRHIGEITSLLKSKCDKLSEFKTKLETITPEYELLKEQTKERRQSADRYKSEFEILRIESQKQLDSIKDKLSEEEIKTGGLNKQLAELDNRNVVLLTELEEMKAKCEELERSNDKLVQKMRNSTSKSKVEAQVEDLKDQIATLQKNMEGASNRIAELQDTKTQIMRELVELQGKYDRLLREKKELERTIAANRAKSNSSNLNDLQEKYEALLQEKNKIALELEANKLVIVQKENDISNYKTEIAQLKLNNKELDEEMDDMVRVIEGLNKDNAELTDQLFDLDVVPITISRQDVKAETCREEKRNIRASSIMSGSNLSNQSERIQVLQRKNGELCEKIEQLTKLNDTLRKENEDLNSKMANWDVKAESKSCNSSRSESPLLENTRRKQRRSDLFNQNRQLENTCDPDTNSQESSTCRCVTLAQQNRDLELEVVRRNGRIAALELQIQSENFPYQNKCRDLEENLLAFKNKNIELRAENKRLQRAMTETSVRDCELCRRRRTNQRDQTTQTIPECKTFLSGMSSGIVDEHMRIQRLEKEKALMKDLCRARMRQIKELEKKVADFEGTPKSDEQVPVEEAKRNSYNENLKSSSNRDKHVFSQNSKRAMKENLPANILGKSTAVSSSLGKNIRSTYS